MRIEPYLDFDGRCEEAVEFYKKAVGAEVLMLMRYQEAPPCEGEGMKPDPKKIMHCTLRMGESKVSASDGRCQGKKKIQGASLAMSVANDAEAEKCFAALSEGGMVSMPLTKTFFSSKFGMVNDRFGVPWMVLVAH